jgi:hypothetical protein
MINDKEIDLVPRIISAFEQLGYDTVLKEGHFLIHPSKGLSNSSICFIYDKGFWQHFIDFNEPLHFISLGKEVNLPEWGVPSDFISKVEYPFFESGEILPAVGKGKKTGRIVYVLNDLADDPNASISLAVIKTFNSLLHLKFYCVVPDGAIDKLKQAANDNIIFLTHTGDNLSFLTECDLLIGTGRVVIKGILSNLPVIVAGKCGFGGLVTTDNFISFLPNHFSGRPGASPGERISPILLAQEINYVFEVMNTKELEDLITISSDHLNVFCWNNLINSFEVIIKEKRLLGEHIDDDSLILQLTPTLSSAIVIDKRGGAADEIFWLRNVNTNKVLAVVGDFEMKLILHCNGENRMSELIEILGEGYAINDCVEFLRSLWALRIVYFQN